jgi:ATP-dependent helicase/DNAse subunit B
LGIAKSFADTIVLLKSNGVDVERLGLILDTRGGAKESDLLKIFKLYESEKTRLGIMDEGDVFMAALRKASTDVFSEMTDSSCILFDEFHQLTPGQLSLIGAIKKSSKNIEIHISAPMPADSGLAYRKYLERNFEKISKIADKLIKYSPQKVQPATVALYCTRSPVQEVRLFALQFLNLSGNNPTHREETILATRTESLFVQDFIIEAIESGILPEDAAPGAAFQSPVIHSLFAPGITDSWPKHASVDEYANLCAQFFKKTGLTEISGANITDSATLNRGAIRSLASLAAIEGIALGIASFAKLARIESMSRENFIQLLIDGSMRSASLLTTQRMLPFRSVGFDVGPAVSARNIFIPQMLEGHLPRAHSERLFFSDTDKLSPEPDQVVDGIFTSVEDALARDAYLFESFRAKCRKNLVLTYSVIDESGSETSKSSFLDGIDAVSPGDIGIKSAASMRKNWKPLAERLVATEISRGRGIIKNPEYHGKITNKSALEIVRERYTTGKFSASSLEKYAQCPFAFFVEKILGLEAPDEDIPELLPKERGTIFHSVVEKFFSRHTELFKKAIASAAAEKKIAAILGEIIKETLEENAQAMEGVAPGLREMQVRAITTLALQVIAMEIAEKKSLPSPLMPVACEWAFGEGDVPCLEVPVEGDVPAKLHGFIDRIDVDDKQTSFLVIDYKTGSSVKSIKQEILSGIKLQLPIYVAAVEKFLFPNSKALGGLLIDVLHAEKKHGFVKKEFNGVCYLVGRAHSSMDDDTWNEALAAALRAVSTYAASIRRGEFFARPAKECPEYCKYDSICRYSGRSSD